MFRKSKAIIAVLMVAAMLASTCSAATYTVKKGDTLWALSRKYGVTIQEIVDANPAIKDPNLIYIDQKLEIPDREPAVETSAVEVPVTETPAPEAPVAGEPAAVESGIAGVTTIAFMDIDGPKVEAIVVEYDTELESGSVDTDTFAVWSYANLEQVYDVGEGNGGEGTDPYSTLPTFEYRGDTEPGSVVRAYVSAAPEIDPEGAGDARGRYVILELCTDYRLSSVCSDWRACLAGGVQQLKDIVSGDVTIAAGEAIVGNYEPGYFWDINPMGSNHSVTLQKVFDDSLYVLENLDGYVIYTDDTTPAHEETHEDTGKPTDRTVTYNVPDATALDRVAGPAFVAENCYSEYDGEYHDVHLMYSIYVPEDYEAQAAAGKKFAMVLHIEDAGALSGDPMSALTEAQAAANYASDRVQQLAKDQGLGGLIVVVPHMTKDDQTVADNLTGNEFLPAVWQLLDHLTGNYAVDTDRIYASGQSMGGMQVLNMAAQRDNYFAAIWAIGSQWGNNYNKEEEYGKGKNAHGYYTYPVDGTIITNEDWQNWYYSISDDNILVTSMTGDASATGYWQQVADLFGQFAGVEIPYSEWSPVALTAAEQCGLLEALVAQDNETGIYWSALSDGSHRATWIYAHALSSGYDWLLSQTRTAEVERGKLEELAGVYAEGQGTLYYNTLTQSAATVAGE